MQSLSIKAIFYIFAEKIFKRPKDRCKDGLCSETRKINIIEMPIAKFISRSNNPHCNSFAYLQKSFYRNSQINLKIDMKMKNKKS